MAPHTVHRSTMPVLLWAKTARSSARPDVTHASARSLIGAHNQVAAEVWAIRYRTPRSS
jgi:hypothetical protein